MLDETDTFPAGAPGREVFRNYRQWAFESAALDLALRQAGRSLADAVGREPRPDLLRGLLPDGRPADDRARHPPARRLPGPPLQARRHAGLDRRPDRRAGRARRRRLDRLQGRLQGHARRHADLAGLLPRGSPRRSRTPGSRTPTSSDEDAREALRPFEDRITWDAPIHSIDDILAAPVLPQHGQPQAVAVRQRALAVRRLRLLRGARHGRLRRRPVRARRRAAGRSSTWRRSSIPTRPTTSPPPATTRSTRSPGCRPRRSSPNSTPPGSAGGSRLLSYASEAASDPGRIQVRARRDAEARVAQRRGAGGRDEVQRRGAGAAGRPRGRAHGRQARAGALPRRDRLRAAAGAPPAAADGRGLAGARRAPRRRPQGGGREARPDAAVQPPAAAPALHGHHRPAAGLQPAAAHPRRAAGDPADRRRAGARLGPRPARRAPVRRARPGDLGLLGPAAGADRARGAVLRRAPPAVGGEGEGGRAAGQPARDRARRAPLVRQGLATLTRAGPAPL